MCLDRKICTNVLAELGQLENEVRTNTFKGETTTLRAIAECPFPQAFVDILQTIEAFEGKPLLECVAAGVAIEHRIQEGRKSTADSSGLGQGQIAFLADRKVQEVERFELRVERQQSEQQQQGKREELASARHMPDLGAAEKSLREMRAEEGRIRMELAKVHAEAARQRALLEKISQAKGQQPSTSDFPMLCSSPVASPGVPHGTDLLGPCGRQGRRKRWQQQGLPVKCCARCCLERQRDQSEHDRSAACAWWC